MQDNSNVGTAEASNSATRSNSLPAAAPVRRVACCHWAQSRLGFAIYDAFYNDVSLQIYLTFHQTFYSNDRYGVYNAISPWINNDMHHNLKGWSPVITFIGNNTLCLCR